MGRRANGLSTNAIWNAGYVAFTMVLSFVVTPVLLHHLGASSYGTLIIVWSISGILGTMNLGLGEATLRYVAQYVGRDDDAGANRVFGAVLSLYILISAAIIISLFFGAPIVAGWLNTPKENLDHVSWLLALSSFSVAASIIMSAFGAVPLALQRFDITTKISGGSGVVRSLGYIFLAVAGMDLIAFVIWDIVIGLLALGLIIRAAKNVFPPLRLLPRMEFSGLKEVFGYSVFSFLTFFLHKWHRESGKFMLARFLGPAPVVYLATPDNVAQRFHEVIASGVEATLPRFSSESQKAEVEKLFWRSTWTALSLSLVVFVPFVILAPDLLRLWIGEEFSIHSGAIGQLLGLYLISQGGFTAPAAYFRGIGKPWVVTIVILGSLAITVISGTVLIPRYGAIGAAYAYLAGSISPFLGMTIGSLYAFGLPALPKMVQNIFVPIISAALSAAIGYYLRTYIDVQNWIELFGAGVLVMLITLALVFGADYISNKEDSTSIKLLKKAAKRFQAA